MFASGGSRFKIILSLLDTVKDLDKGVHDSFRGEILFGKSPTTLLHRAALFRLAGE
jgi:hypothetical protein